ncbi:MAG TPA: response regulator [Terriglobales bacterium]|nr:response regulator [Terriglobales bacterium]
MATVFCFAEKRHRVSQLSGILRTAHHQVTSCYSIREAIKQLGHTQFDIVVTDYHNKRKYGLRVLRAAKEGRNVPVVVISRKLAEAFQAGDPYADLYLDEPVSPEELATLVEALATADKSLPISANLEITSLHSAVAAASAG